MSFLSIDSRKRCRNLIADDEGFRSSLYSDSRGFPTIGFGFNLSTTEIPLSIALDWLDYLLSKIEHDLCSYPMLSNIWPNLSDARKYVLINMAYQMGIGGLLNFHGMIKGLADRNYLLAAAEMKDSIWYREFPGRANRLVNIMISGEF